ncbi:unnamed protein product [Microthlaspi erraticum]|uniref:Uncharacterized protein n=1 Tax=Microthlaspi erraticum TaxID=1685480 RepID=A0A6D2HKP7_9BRAS|nr:unnamed protein product [Microthlaspi erraticum]
MAPPADDPSTRLQSQLGADGNPIVHPVEVDATNGHVNPPPPPVPDVEAPVTTAALTAAMQGFAAQIAAEMQAQQQKYNDKIDSLHVTSDGRTATRQVAKLRRNLDAINSKVHSATSSTPDNTGILTETQKIGDSKTVTSISSLAETPPP